MRRYCNTTVEDCILDFLRKKIPAQCCSIIEHVVKEMQVSEKTVYNHLRILNNRNKILKEKYGKESFYYLPENKEKAESFLKESINYKEKSKKEWEKQKREIIEEIKNWKKEYPEKFYDFLKEVLEKGIKTWPDELIQRIEEKEIQRWTKTGKKDVIGFLHMMKKEHKRVCVLINFPDEEIRKKVVEILGITKYEEVKRICDDLERRYD